MKTTEDKNTVKIILVDDHVLVRDGIKALLEHESTFKVIAEASNGKDALEMLPVYQPDLLIVDIRMPEMNGNELITIVSKQFPDIKTLVLSMHDAQEYVLESIEAGADGYMLKGASKPEFLKALCTISDGGKYFSGDVSSILLNSLTHKEPAPSSKKGAENTFNLSKREKQVLSIILNGKSNKEIAEELNVSKRTAEVHRYNLMKKLKVKNLMELSNKARAFNLVDY
ncbi:MAG: response regulator transcription factor [Flavobacteriales bacterium]|nr:response regulator transcription factor [Flavobacteriales bacterium]